MRDDLPKNPSPSAPPAGTLHVSACVPATFVPLACTPDTLTITIDPSLPPAPCADERERWQQLCVHNPRLFNGPILRYQSCDAQACAITASRECYLRYAVQRIGSAQAHTHDLENPQSMLYQLAVTGLFVQTDAAGREHILLGKRARETWVYPDCWELAPAGGLENADFLGQLETEMHEELGETCQGVTLCAATKPCAPAVSSAQALCRVLGLTLDPNTPSADIIVRVDLAPAHDSVSASLGTGSAWEYAQVRWVRIDELGGFVASHNDSIIPPTRAALHALGWLNKR